MFYLEQEQLVTWLTKGEENSTLWIRSVLCSAGRADFNGAEGEEKRRIWVALQSLEEIKAPF